MAAMSRRTLFSLLLAAPFLPQGKVGTPAATLAPRPEVALWTPPYRASLPTEPLAEALRRSYRDAQEKSP